MSKNQISIRISASVASGKTHVAETIRKALVAEYGEEVGVCIALTDVEHDKRSRDELERPGKDVGFKIIECVGKR